MFLSDQKVTLSQFQNLALSDPESLSQAKISFLLRLKVLLSLRFCHVGSMGSLATWEVFMTLNKKERTLITQRMRSFESAYVNAVLERINHFLEEPELFRPPSWSTSSQKRRQGGISGSINDLMQALRSNLKIEVQYWENVSRAGYLTGLQMSMGKFFVILRDLSMSQKDQITIVQSLFDSFHVDWDEGDRENIKMSLQKPALANYEKQRRELRQISSRPFSKTLTPEMILTLEELTYLYKKYLRRF